MLGYSCVFNSAPHLWHCAYPTIWDQVYLEQETQARLSSLRPGSLSNPGYLSHQYIYIYPCHSNSGQWMNDFHAWHVCSLPTHLVWFYFSHETTSTHIDEGHAIPWFNWSQLWDYWLWQGFRVRTFDIFKDMKLDQITRPGLLLARTYAISSQSRMVLGILGFLVLGNLINSVVCPMTRPL